VARRMALLSDVATTGAICGVYHVQIVPRPATESAGTQPPRLINLYPGIVFPRWLPDDVDTILAYELRFRAGADTARTIYTLDDETRTEWSTWQEKLTRRGWEVTTKPQAWPYAWPPIVTGKNLPNPHSFYGLSDLQDIDLNDSINFVASNINRILRIHAHPRLWSTGMTGKELSNDPDKIPNLPQNATLNTVATQTSMTSSVEHLRALTTALYETARVPEMNPQDMSLGAQSGFALQVLHSDLLAKTEVKRRLYGAMLVELNRRVLDLMGYGPDNRVTLHWADALPADVRQEINALTFDANQEIASKQTLATKRGYDYETERERMDQEQVDTGNVGGRILGNFMNGLDGRQL